MFGTVYSLYDTKKKYFLALGGRLSQTRRTKAQIRLQILSVRLRNIFTKNSIPSLK
jgi:hypothetical protein